MILCLRNAALMPALLALLLCAHPGQAQPRPQSAPVLGGPDALLDPLAQGMAKTILPLLPASTLTMPQAEAIAALLPFVACADATSLEPLLDVLQDLQPNSPRGALLLAFALPPDLRLAHLARGGHRLFLASPEAGHRLLTLLLQEGLTTAQQEALLPPIAAALSATDRKAAEAVLDHISNPASKARALFSTALLSAAHSGDLPEWWAAHILDSRLAALAATEGLLRAVRLGTLDNEDAERRLALQKDKPRGYAAIPRLYAFPGASGGSLEARANRLPQGPFRQRAQLLAALGNRSLNGRLAVPPKAALDSPWNELLNLWLALPPTHAPAPNAGAPQESTKPWDADWELFSGALRLLDSYPRSARDGCEGIGDETLRDECRFRVFLHTLERDPRGARGRLVEIVDSGLRLRAALLVALALKEGSPATALAPLAPLFSRAGALEAQEASLQVLDRGADPALAYYLLERQVTNPSLRCRALWRLGAAATGLEEVLPSQCTERFCLAAGALAAALKP